MELRYLKQQVPPRHAISAGPPDALRKLEQTKSVEEAKNPPDNDLGVVETEQSNDGLRETTQQNRT